MELTSPRRFQFSIRSLLIATALLALSLVPFVWVLRERRQVLRAREEAIRSVLLAERHRAELRVKGARSGAGRQRPGPDPEALDPPSVTPEILIEHLRRENNELKDTVDSLRTEVERLRAAGVGRRANGSTRRSSTG